MDCRKVFVTDQPIDNCAKDGGEEFFTMMHCGL